MDDDVTITPYRDGPYIVRGTFTVTDQDGNAIPVILYSARAANGSNSAQVQAALTKSHESIDHLIATLRRHMSNCYVPVHSDKEVA